MNSTTDLHSMGQYIQEGRKNMFETVLNVKCDEEIVIRGLEGNSNADGWAV